VWPYEPTTLQVPENEARDAVAGALWPWRTRLAQRVAYGKSQIEHGLQWFEYSMFFANRFRTPLSIAFAFVATHNHFVLDRGGKVFNRSAPVIKLPPGATEDEHLALLGLLNSSTLGFWMKQVFHVKGGESTGKKRQSEVWSRRLEFDATKLGAAPIVTVHRDRIIQLTGRLDDLAREYVANSATTVLESDWRPDGLERLLREAHDKRRRLRDQQVALQEELDWTVYVAFRIASDDELAEPTECEPLASEHRPFAIRLARAYAAGAATNYWFEAMGVNATTEVPESYSAAIRKRLVRRLESIESNATLGLIESAEYKRKWEPTHWNADVSAAAFAWLATRLESVVAKRDRLISQPQLIAAVQDDARVLTVASVYQERRDVDLAGLVAEFLAAESVPSHRFHVYTGAGLAKRAAWEDVWQLQRREDAGEKIAAIPVPPEYSQGSRGKSTDFLKTDFWHLRGKLDVPKERFIAFTEVPGRSGVETLYGWAGWTAQQRVKAILAIDEELEDASVPLADRIGLLESAWRLLPDVARGDAAAANRLKAELQALVGPEGPSRELIEDWKKRFPPPTTRAARAKKAAAARDNEESDTEESDES
jgi:hypothetical protein